MYKQQCMVKKKKKKKRKEKSSKLFLKCLSFITIFLKSEFLKLRTDALEVVNFFPVSQLEWNLK